MKFALSGGTVLDAPDLIKGCVFFMFCFTAATVQCVHLLYF